jgi:hypothetical protein
VLKAQSLWFQRLKLQCDEPLSIFAFNFSLRRYHLARRAAVAAGLRDAAASFVAPVLDSLAGAYTP